MSASSKSSTHSAPTSSASTPQPPNPARQSSSSSGTLLQSILRPEGGPMRNTELLDKIDATIEAKNLLKHPFYQDWQAGKLTREPLQLYSAQYYHHVKAVPKHLRVRASHTHGPLRDIFLENLAEEENPANVHPKLRR